MIEKKMTFMSSDGEHELKAKCWLPDGDVRGVLQIVHGMNEYIARYEGFARFMTENGFAVAGDDHLGHGESANGDEELGWFGESGGADYLTEDEHLFHDLLRTEFPDVPYFLLGHSMGSFITRNYVASYEDELTGYICMGTAGKNTALPVAKLLSRIIRDTKGARYRSEFLKNLSFTGYNDHFKDENDPNAWLSRNLESRKQYGADPWTQFTFTTQGYRDLYQLLDDVTGTKWAEKIRKTLPILIVSGDMDPVGSCGRGPEEVYSWLEEIGMKDVTLKLFRGDRHELLNETNRYEIYRYLLDWMDRTTEKSGIQ
jgi:alpha-beta hydrolase superfamily lysophospholipase